MARARLWVEDLGYLPDTTDGKADPAANGKDDNGDGLIDFPADPGCAFADDDTEEARDVCRGNIPARLLFVAAAQRHSGQWGGDTIILTKRCKSKPLGPKSPGRGHARRERWVLRDGPVRSKTPATTTCSRSTLIRARGHARV
jgi:hypothetical protein